MSPYHTDYVAHGAILPDPIRESIDAYVKYGRPTGGFLEAVIENDLTEAWGRADHINIKLIHVIVDYLYNECPSTCWGKAGAFDAWIAEKERERERMESRAK